MSLSKYVPEIICLILFTHFSCLWVISLNEDKTNNTQLSPLLALQKLIPQHEVELLNANFSDQLHYDQLAQLQSEVEALISEANFSNRAEQLFRDYKETSLSYTQLTSMLKTSQRLISENSRFENTQLMQVINNIRLKIFSFISTPNKTDKAALTELLFSINITDKQQPNWRNLQLIKLHSLFILNNYELTSTYRRKLIEMPVFETLDQEQALLRQQTKKTTIKQFAGIIGTILALVMLFIVVIKRNQHALKMTSEQHEEFALNIMDMLGPHEKKEQALRTQNDRAQQDKEGVKPTRHLSRK